VPIPLLTYSPTTLPKEMPFATSSSVESRPAVTPPANAAKLICTLLAMMLVAIRGRKSWGSSM
jgi:hypothetical protein